MSDDAEKKAVKPAEKPVKKAAKPAPKTGKKPVEKAEAVVSYHGGTVPESVPGGHKRRSLGGKAAG